MHAVDLLHAELNYAERLDGLRGLSPVIWNAIQDLERSARRDARYLPRYRAILEKGIAELEVFDVQQLEADFQAWYEHTRLELGIPDREWRRLPATCEGWSQKWLQRDWAAFDRARQRAANDPSPRAYQLYREATLAMMRAYIGAFDPVVARPSADAAHLQGGLPVRCPSESVAQVLPPGDAVRPGDVS
jgi:hypothetical protein